MASEGRSAIKVGSGYVEVTPKITSEQKFRAALIKEMEKAGVEGGKAFTKATAQGVKGASKAVEKEAKQGAAATKKAAKETEAALKKAEQYVTKEAGKEAAKRLKTYVRAEKDKQKATEGLSAVLKRLSQQAIKDTKAEAKAKVKAAEDAKKAAERAEKAKATAAKSATREAEKAERHRTTEHGKESRLRMAQEKHEAAQRASDLRDETARRKEADRVRLLGIKEQNDAAKAAHVRRLEEIREQSARQRLANDAVKAALQQQIALSREASRQMRESVADIQRNARIQTQSYRNQISAQQSELQRLRTLMRGARNDIRGVSGTTTQVIKGISGQLRTVGTWFDNIGTSINEAGNILTSKFLAPLALAGTALTTIGVGNADKRLLGQLGLSASGVSKQTSADQMRAIQTYAIDTPFSIDVMHEYQMKLIRSVAGSDKDWFKGGSARTNAANSAAEKTTDLIMAIGDSMARAGNLNPTQFQRAMYAMDMIMDMDRAPTRSVKQLAAASGMPASELANLLGFKNSQEMWKVVGTPAKDGGGVSGTEIMNSMLNYWNPGKYGGEYGPKTSGGSVGFASRMTSETITGRIQQMKERAVFELGNLFVEEGKGGQYQYTDLGQKIMGKQVPVYGEDRKGNRVVTGYRNEGGILNQVTDMAKKYSPSIEKFLKLFLDSLQRFITMIDSVASFFKEHKTLTDFGKSIAEFLVQWGPLIIAVGLLSKVFGKVAGIAGRLLQPLGSLVQGTARGVRGVGRVRAQRAAANDARATARANGDSRRDVRQAGRTAYRNERANQRGDNDRRTLRQRAVDGLTGDRSDVRQTAQGMADLERQARAAEEEISRLRREIRQVNEATTRQIQAAMSGGNNSVQGATNQANTAVNNLQTNLAELNRAHLNNVRQESEKLEAAAKKVTKEFGDAHTKVNSLNGEKLGKVTSEADHLKNAAEAAGKQITSANTRVGNLNGKHVKDVTASMNDLRGMAKRAADQIGDGSMSSSASGRTANLNKRRLTDVINEFKKLLKSADDVYDKIGQGTGAGSVAGRIGLLNNRSLKKVTDAVNDLAKALKKARDEGDGLDGALDRIGKKSPGGGGSSGSGGKKSKRSARGGLATQADVGRYGVLPGYSPWVDNIPAILSPGEAVLRPEVTHAIGEEQINTWNAMAVRGKISRHARGTSGGGGKFDLDQIKELIGHLDISSVGTAMLKTMKLDGTSDRLGGSTQGGILRTGDHSAGLGGSAGAEKFRGVYDWMTEDLFTTLKKVPSGVGQAAGVLAGALAPVQRDYFWNDVWKGSGNIVDRGQAYMGHLFSLETLSKVWDNLYSGVSDSLGAIWDTVTNPFDAFSNVFGDIGDIVSGSYNNFIGMIDTVKEIKDAPFQYAGRVYDDFMANAEESMPNTEGLFDFKKGAKVNAKVPDFAEATTANLPKGKGANRWSLVASQALQMLGLPSSALSTVLYRINMESGGDPNIVNKWDSNWTAGHPSVGLMQVIGPTYDAYAGPFRSTGPKLYGTSVNPLANIYAGLNYARNRYGSGWQRMLSGKTGYASGTSSASPGLAMVGEKGRELVDFGSGGQRVYSNAETEALLGKKYEIHIHEARNETTPQAVMRALQQAEALYL
ncbi:hypothetical protein ACFRCI_17280 [Streptomyces sp. NPDC056638]|uniref:hypothetical protein n=1 Tax=Streptomyces sp. NPDC056638 TaxID=3345887 RepID=UPI00368BF836